MKRTLLSIVIAGLFSSCSAQESVVYLDELDLSPMETGWGEVKANLSAEGNPLSVAGQVYKRGVGTHAVSSLLLDLQGKASIFHSFVGVDDESGKRASVEFFVLGDGWILWHSGTMRYGDPARQVKLDVKGIKKLGLYVSDGGDGIGWDHADWLDAKITYSKTRPATVRSFVSSPYVLTPPAPETPRINGPEVYGARPGHFLLYRVPVTGKRPVTYAAEGLPGDLKLDPQKGIISGTCTASGDYPVRLKASNSLGQDEKTLLLRIGDAICLTPPMGWNSWNCWGLSVDQKKVEAAVDAMVSSGLADHGWSYINIDDGWEAASRTASGELLSNDKFPDMKALGDYAHRHGLKLGIYSSPGTHTCGGYLGSWEHEFQDAQTWAKWGIDYLKYDWCSYDKIAKDQSLAELQKPYLKMREALRETGRDIVFSLCQYGRGDVWQWGVDVGGNLWRTTGDITDTWSSMAGIGFRQDKCSPYASPGHWNDPDMLVVGNVGWGPSLHPSQLTPDEQYTHISLWSLLSAPLLIGCDLGSLDAFTLNLLTNDEVIAIDQDPLGKQAVKVKETAGQQVWKKQLADGSLAVGLFNTGDPSPAGMFNWTGKMETATVSVTLQELGISGPKKVRDLWRQKDLGVVDQELNYPVNHHGVVLLRLSEPAH
ncbi:MAG TPA: NPCBM/NEW2 domain-containing protein [Bacteroidales bacterium]|nr:NPCBM/NEW2 domain-containing protein [Bacteroidales bacterium]HNS46806.1 NPCBM/NEW2 domain-containing protein [Bacteroidales bacterium]